MTVEPREFHFEEYKHLKQQISSLLDRVTTIIQFILGAAAAVYAWVITNGVNAAAGMWIPVVLFLFAMMMVIQIVYRIHAIRDFLKILEEYLHNSSPPLTVRSGAPVSGWEEFRALDPSSARWEWIAVTFLGVASFLTLVLAGVVTAGWLPISAPHQVTIHCSV
jgi:hypothetical protein